LLQNSFEFFLLKCEINRNHSCPRSFQIFDVASLNKLFHWIRSIKTLKSLLLFLLMFLFLLNTIKFFFKNRLLESFIRNWL
jgi:hypothetical protein